VYNTKMVTRFYREKRVRGVDILYMKRKGTNNVCIYIDV